MTDFRSQLTRTLKFFSPMEGMNATPVPGVHCVKFSRTDRRTKRRWRACLGIVAQGEKEIVLGRETYRIDEANYSATPIDLPVISRVASASLEKPFLCVLLDLDPMILSEVSAQLGKEISADSENALRGVFIGKASEEMLQASVRLVNLFHTPDDAAVLGPFGGQGTDLLSSERSRWRCDPAFCPIRKQDAYHLPVHLRTAYRTRTRRRRPRFSQGSQYEPLCLLQTFQTSNGDESNSVSEASSSVGSQTPDD